MYLYEDAAKAFRSSLFAEGKYSTYSSACKYFDENALSLFKGNIEIDTELIGQDSQENEEGIQNLKNRGYKMNIQILKELKPYSLFELENMFNVDEDEVRNILKSLSLMNIVKKLSKDTSKIELEELLDIESLEELNVQMESDMYVFKYVGILMVGEICLILYPKYSDRYLSDETNNFKMLKQIISVIRKYQSKNKKIGLGRRN